MSKQAGIVMIGLVSLVSWAYGQKPPITKPAVLTKQEPKKRSIDFEIEDSKTNNKTGITTGRNFTYKEKDTVITGQKVRYNDNENRLLAEGDLVLDDPEHHVVGDKADIDNSAKKLAVITGKVIITLKPKQDPMPQPNGAIPVAPVVPPDGAKTNDDENVSSSRGRGVVITCDRVESLYRKKYVKIFGKEVRFTQKFTGKNGKEIERVVLSEHAEYDGKKDQLVLFPPVKATDSEGQTMNFVGKVYVGTKEGEETLESKEKSTGTFKIPEEEEDDTPQTSPKPLR